MTGREMYEQWAGRTVSWEELTVTTQSAWLESASQYNAAERKSGEAMESVPVVKLSERLGSVERRIDEMRVDYKAGQDRLWDILESIRDDLKSPETDRRGEAWYNTLHEENKTLRDDIAALRRELSNMREDLTKRIGRVEGRSGGMKDAVGWLIALAAIAISMFALLRGGK